MLTEQTVLEFMPDSKQQEAARVLNFKDREPALPVTIKIMLGLGVFIAAMFFIISFVTFAYSSVHYKTIFVSTGITAMVLACAAQVWVRKIKSSSVKFFCTQVMLIAMLFGRGAILAGTFTQPDVTLVDAWLGIAFLLVLIPFLIFNNSIDRFLAMIVFMAIVYLRFSISFSFAANVNIVFTAFVLSSILFMTKKRVYSPVAWALTVSMAVPFGIMLACPQCAPKAHYTAVIFNHYKVLLALFYSLIIINYAFVNKYLNIKYIAVPFAVFAVLLPFNLPIVYGASYLFMGKYYRDSKLKTLGYITLYGGIIYLYYSLDVTLLTKSLLLMGSGAVLIIIREVLKRFKYEI